MDLFGASDPYCSCLVGTEKKRTSVQSDNLNPLWNETLDFIVWDVASQSLLIYVKDDDIGVNELLGTVEVALRHLEPNVNTELSLPLDQGPGNIQLDVLYRPFLREPPKSCPPPDSVSWA